MYSVSFTLLYLQGHSIVCQHLIAWTMSIFVQNSSSTITTNNKIWYTILAAFKRIDQWKYSLFRILYYSFLVVVVAFFIIISVNEQKHFSFHLDLNSMLFFTSSVLYLELTLLLQLIQYTRSVTHFFKFILCIMSCSWKYMYIKITQSHHPYTIQWMDRSKSKQNKREKKCAKTKKNSNNKTESEMKKKHRKI